MINNHEKSKTISMTHFSTSFLDFLDTLEIVIWCGIGLAIIAVVSLVSWCLCCGWFSGWFNKLGSICYHSTYIKRQKNVSNEMVQENKD